MPAPSTSGVARPDIAQYHAMIVDARALIDWSRRTERALDCFERAEKGAELSPPDLKTHELTAALRGTAYVDVELGKLDHAAALYVRCLALDPEDAEAARELEFVRARQTRQISCSPRS